VTARAVLLLFNVIETNVLRASSTSEFSHSLDPERTSAPISVEPGWVQILARRPIAKC
jgi:hypothetical protein